MILECNCSFKFSLEVLTYVCLCLVSQQTMHLMILNLYFWSNIKTIHKHHPHYFHHECLCVHTPVSDKSPLSDSSVFLFVIAIFLIRHEGTISLEQIVFTGRWKPMKANQFDQQHDSPEWSHKLVKPVRSFFDFTWAYLLNDLWDCWQKMRG